MNGISDGFEVEFPPGSTVILFDNVTGNEIERLDAVFTSYNFEVLPGEYRLEVLSNNQIVNLGIIEDPDGTPDAETIITIVEEDSLGNDFGFPIAEVCGSLVVNNEPVPNETVTVVDADGIEFQAVTDENGEFCLEAAVIDAPSLEGEETVSANVVVKGQTEVVSSIIEITSPGLYSVALVTNDDPVTTTTTEAPTSTTSSTVVDNETSFTTSTVVDNSSDDSNGETFPNTGASTSMFIFITILSLLLAMAFHLIYSRKNNSQV